MKPFGALEIGSRQFLACISTMAIAIASPSAYGQPVNLLCDVEVRFPIQGFGQPTSNSRSRIHVLIDQERRQGTYNGLFAISADRPGSLRVSGENYFVTWKGSYWLQGQEIVEETLAIYRMTGRFSQTVTLSSGRQFNLMEGTCQKSAGPLF